MKLYILASTALFLFSAPAAASISSATVATHGGGFASACYAAAAARQATSDNIFLCDRALAAQRLSDFDVMATHVNRGILRMLRGDQAAAVADFDTAIGMNPSHPEAWLNKGVVTFDRGDSGSASQLAQKALDLGTRKPALAYYIRGFADEDRGKTSAAYSNFRRAAELAPSWSLPREELKRYRVVSR